MKQKAKVLVGVNGMECAEFIKESFSIASSSENILDINFSDWVEYFDKASDYSLLILRNAPSGSNFGILYEYVTRVQRSKSSQSILVLSEEKVEVKGHSFNSRFDVYNNVRSYGQYCNDLIKEIALICLFIRENELLKGTIFNTFDESLEIAKAFIEKYPIETVWGVEHETGDYEECIVEFTRQYLREKSS